jgi:hypothetical protein
LEIPEVEADLLPYIKISKPATLNKSVHLTYIFSDISWDCIASGIIARGSMLLRLAAHVVNNTNMSISCDTYVVSGQVNTISTPSYRQFSGLTTAPRAYSPAVQSEASGGMSDNLLTYSLGKRRIGKTNIIELGTLTLPVSNIYVHTLLSNVTQYGYSFIAPGAIPSCNVNIYLNSIDNYIGADTIMSTVKDMNVQLLLGKTTRFVVTSTERDIGSRDLNATSDADKTEPIASSSASPTISQSSSRIALQNRSPTTLRSMVSRTTVPFIIDDKEIRAEIHNPDKIAIPLWLRYYINVDKVFSLTNERGEDIPYIPYNNRRDGAYITFETPSLKDVKNLIYHIGIIRDQQHITY